MLALLKVVLILAIFSERKSSNEELFKYSSYIAQSRCKSGLENVSMKTEFAHVTVSQSPMPWGSIRSYVITKELKQGLNSFPKEKDKEITMCLYEEIIE